MNPPIIPPITCMSFFQGSNNTLGGLFNYVTCIIENSVIPMIFALAIVLFIWGVVQYVINDSEEGKKEKGKLFMVWGIIGLVVMTSVWGIVKVVGNTFGLKTVIPKVSPQ